MALSDYVRAADGLKARPQAVVEALGLSFRKDAPYLYIQGAPARGKNSFCIFPNGTWTDFKGPHGVGRDMLDLVELVTGAGKAGALAWAEAFLGIRREGVARASDAELAKLDAAARVEREKKAAEDRLLREKVEKQCASTWLNLPRAPGTIVETYCEARTLGLMGNFPRFPSILRCEPEARFYFRLGTQMDGNGRPYSPYTAMTAAFINFNGKITGLHRTFLEPDGRQKARIWDGRDWMNAKKMRGTKRGSFIPISKGDGDLGLTEAARQGVTGTLAICEGIETALSVAIARPDYRVWAAGDKGNMAALPWHAAVSGVVLVADNDGDDVAAQDQAFAGVARYWRDLADGRPLKVARSEVGNDYNDWLRE